MYGLGPVPFNDDCAVASMNMLPEYEVILLTSEGGKEWCKWSEFSRRLEKPGSYQRITARLKQPCPSR
jgi:hypothetical protein